MPRFQVFRALHEDLLLLDLQADLLGVLKTRIVAPLLPIEDTDWAMGHLNPRFKIADRTYVMATQRMAAISVAEIGEAVDDLSGHRDSIVRATDFLFQGF